MNIIFIILLGLAGIIVLLLILGLFMRKNHYVKREIIINAPVQKVFDYVRLLKNQWRPLHRSLWKRKLYRIIKLV